MKKPAFRYCLNTSTIWCKGSKLTLPAKFDLAAKAGYDGIEPWVKEVDEYAAGGGDLGDLAKRAGDAGLTVANLIGFFEWSHPDFGRRSQGLEEARRCFKLAQKLGCTRVAAPPTGIHELAGVDPYGIAERYGVLIDIARKYGVVPVVEFWGVAKSLGHLGEALLVAAESGRSEACILADVFHIYKSSGHFHGLKMIGAGALGLFHVNDYPADPPRERATDACRVYPGDGVAPLKEIFGYLHKAGYSGMLSLELFNETYWAQNPRTVARTGLEKLKAAVQTAVR